MKKLKGFTLIELLVVIAIIAILAAILFPVFATAKERARQVKCLNNLKQLSIAFTQYANDFDGVMPIGSSTMMYPSETANRYDWVGSPWVSKPVWPERGHLWRYTKNRAIYSCPTDKNLPYKEAAMRDATAVRLSYSLNKTLATTRDGKVKLDANTSGRASKILLLIHEDAGINDGYFAWPQQSDIPDKLHYDGTATIYCDSHARWCSTKELRRQMDALEWNITPQ